MEYQVQLKNAFNRNAVLEQLRGGRMYADPFGNNALYRPYQARTAPHFSPAVHGQLLKANAGQPPAHQAADFALYFLTSRGGREKDYYHLDSRCLIYDRQIRWAYWQEAMPTVAKTGGLEVTVAQLKAICPPASMADINKHISHLNVTMTKYKINTRLRQAHFLAQVAHESDKFRTAREYASGGTYEGRKDIGNTQPGDGKRFRGRGLIQPTGRDVYSKYGKYIGQNLTDGENMRVVEQEPYASDASGWFWYYYKQSSNMNKLADEDKFLSITRVINGGTRGKEERKKFLDNAKKTFGI